MGPKQNDRVVRTQPNSDDVWQYEHPWSHGLCDCCSKCGRCCYAWFCLPCFMGSLFKRSGECYCQCCIPGSIMSLRAKLRTGFRIEGSLCSDFCVTSFCPVCAVIQMDSELDAQELY